MKHYTDTIVVSGDTTIEGFTSLLRRLREQGFAEPGKDFTIKVEYLDGIATVELDGIDRSTGESVPDEQVEQEEWDTAAYIVAACNALLALLDERDRLREALRPLLDARHASAHQGDIANWPRKDCPLCAPVDALLGASDEH